MRPALALLAVQSARFDSVRVLPAGSNQVSPSERLKVVKSDKPPSLYFCSLTPLPLAISGSSEIGKINTFLFSDHKTDSPPAVLNQQD